MRVRRVCQVVHFTILDRDLTNKLPSFYLDQVSSSGEGYTEENIYATEGMKPTTFHSATEEKSSHRLAQPFPPVSGTL